MFFNNVMRKIQQQDAGDVLLFCCYGFPCGSDCKCLMLKTIGKLSDSQYTVHYTPFSLPPNSILEGGGWGLIYALANEDLNLSCPL